MTSQKTHYRLPLDTEFDKEIIDWINTFPSDKKGEMVRHAIRYYMELEGTKLSFPKLNTSQAHEYRNSDDKGPIGYIEEKMEESDAEETKPASNKIKRERPKIMPKF